MLQEDLNNMSMLDLFKMETKSQCQTLESELKILHNKGWNNHSAKTIIRALHSIKGAAAIIDLKEVVRLCKTVENAVSSRGDLHPENKQIFFDSILELTEFFHELTQQPTPSIPAWIDGHPVLTRLTATFANYDRAIKRDEPPESALTFPVDLSMFGIFQEDAGSHCGALSSNLLSLERHPNDTLTIESAMRSTHSIKGAARVIGLEPIVQISHAMEEVLIAAHHQDIDLSTEHIDILFAGLDFLKSLLEVKEARLLPWLEEQTPRLREILSALKHAASNQEIGDHNIIFSSKNRAPSSQEEISHKQEDSPIAPPSPGPQTQNFVKVSTEGLTRLMALTGEILSEVRWQPTLLKKSLELKRKTDDMLRRMDKIRALFHSSHFDLRVEEAFRALHKEDQKYRELVDNYLGEIDEHTRNAGEISHRLHKELINNRMQPFSEGIKDLPRMVRDLGRKLGKKINLEIDGSETMVDREILALLKAPLNHLIVNAIDHGIEPPQERLTANKPEKAALRLEAKHIFGVLKIVIADDGRGIDIENLRKVIVAKDLVSEEIATDLQENELLEFLFLPNFSTKGKANHISGRGVGLDIVQSMVRDIRGSVTVSTIEGRGTIFELQLPLSLFLSKCLIVTINNELYGIPLVRVDRACKLDPNEITKSANQLFCQFEQKRINLLTSQQVLGLKEYEFGRKEYNIVILHNIAKRYGLIVDSFQGIRDLMVQPLSSRLGKLRSVSAASIGEDGTPIIILDTSDIIQSMEHLISGKRLHNIDSAGNITAKRRVKRILVVDDSATVREVEKKILTENGYVVVSAVDGVDGWQRAQEQPFDLIITDIDMPHMDGIELVLQIKDDDRFENLPIIIVSYKDRDVDRNRGLEAGADYYLTKGSFQDQTLLDAVTDLIGPAEEE